MKMKKMLLGAVGLLAAASFAVAGCGGSGDSGSASKTLRVGTNADFAPFEFQGENGKEYEGFDMDLARAVAEEMGMTAEIQNINFDGLIPALVSKNIDIAISGMTINDERKENVLFSNPYYESGLTMVVRENETGIQKFQDLKGHKVAVQIGTTSAAEVKKIEGVEVREFNTPADCFMELKAGGVDAVVNDRPVNDYYLHQSGTTGVKALAERLTSEDYGIAMAKGSEDMQKKINDALQKLKENGEYDKIYQKWFGEKQ